MWKQQHLLVVFFLIVAIVTAVIYMRRSGRLQDQLDAAVLENGELKQRLERETNTRLGVQQELATLRQALSGQEAALHEFLQRVHVVHDAMLEITIEATRTETDASSSVPVFPIELVTSDGRVWRFMNDYEQQPTVTVVGEDRVRLSARCAPVRAADIQGRPVAELGAVTRLRTQYQPALAGAGFMVSPEATKEVVLLLDGMEVVRAAPTPLAPDTWEYDVSSAFTGLYVRYQEQLRSRLAAAANATPANSQPPE
jgi:hypothetical protein